MARQFSKFSVLSRLAIVALTLIALGAILAACSPAAPAPAATAAPTVVPQPTQPPAPTAAPATQAAPAATKAAVPAATQATNQTIPTAAPAPTAAKPAAVSFAKDVLPIFEQNCVKCHGGQQTKAGLVLTGYAQTMKGSENGPVIKVGDAANSFLVQQIINGKMPQRAAKLPQAQIDLISAWVNAGAPNN
ncbi:MAG: c-type cytochrome [Chloroflexi bacterium]|nr:c-type cytochrome [Chloroflexota bacterium]